VASRHSCPDEAGNRGRLSFVSLLADEDRAALERLGRRVSFPAGTVLMHEGLPGEGVLLMLAGVVKATHTTEAGHEAILAFRGAGDLIGELALIDDRPHSSTVIAVEPVEAIVIPSRDFRALAERRPAVAVALMRMVVDRFRDTDRRLIEFSASDALGRVAARLLELAETHGQPSEGGVTIALHLSKDDLACLAG
jgi:CRP/FNR family cyclic AMP-dependent transcriptional regulator